MRPSYTLFVFTSTERAGDDLAGQFADVGRQVRDEVGEAVKVIGILGQGTPKPGEVPIFADFKRSFRDKLGAKDGSALLVRPDGYLAFHRQGYQAGLREVQQRWVQRSGVTPGQELPFAVVPIARDVETSTHKTAN